MTNSYKGLPQELAELLIGLDLSKQIEGRLKKIARNNPKAIQKETVIDESINGIIERNLDKLRTAGWSDREIHGISQSPADLSLIQVLRPNSQILQITKESVSIQFKTGAKITHARESQRIKSRKPVEAGPKDN